MKDKDEMNNTDEQSNQSSSEINKLSVLYQNDYYIVIDKPHDIRMDGDYNNTIQKLLLSTCPNSTITDFKWIHQLDYATSGCLCIARTKEAAAIATKAFENRETNKEYLAILDGHLDCNKYNNISMNEYEDIKSILYNNIESINKKNEHKHKSAPNPQSSSFILSTAPTATTASDTWQVQARYDLLMSCLTHLNTYISTHPAPSTIDPTIIHLSTIPIYTYLSGNKLRKALRKALKTLNIHIPTQPITSTHTESSTKQRSLVVDSVSVKVSGEQYTSHIYNKLHDEQDKINSYIFHYTTPTSPTTTKARTTDPGDDSSSNISTNSSIPNNHTIIVFIPIVEPLGDFKVDIDLDSCYPLLSPYLSSDTYTVPVPDDAYGKLENLVQLPENKMGKRYKEGIKYAETWITPLEYGIYKVREYTIH